MPSSNARITAIDARATGGAADSYDDSGGVATVTRKWSGDLGVLLTERLIRSTSGGALNIYSIIELIAPGILPLDAGDALSVTFRGVERTFVVTEVAKGPDAPGAPNSTECVVESE